MNYVLTPLDTLFFRDGRPFNTGETGQMEVETFFPPTPTTIVGALRASLARAQGWNGHEDWPSNIRQVLGDGENLGSLQFAGPYLLRHGEPLFPAPLLLLGKQPKAKEERWRNFLRLRPSDTPLETDLGKVQLPVPVGKTDGHKALERCWLTKAGMEAVLEGGIPESKEVFWHSDLWKTEPRVGIKREPGSRTTKEDSLYNIQHLRLREGVSVAVSIEGLANDWTPQSPALLGGESRMVWVKPADDLPLPSAPQLDGNMIRYTVTLITPAHFPDDGWARANGKLGDLPGKIVSACIGKPVMIGGWDSRARVPLPLRPYLPAGSTWFMEASASDEQQTLARHGKHIGEKTAWGYGQILIGTWREQ